MDFLGIFIAIVVALGVALLFVVFLVSPSKKSRKKSAFSPDFGKKKWVEIQFMLTQGGPANYRQAIMEGDKLVDAVLRSRVSGETMGERLKNARSLFEKETYNDLWTAHKIRNKVAHESDFDGLSSDARLAVRYFERALKELGAI